MPGLMGRITDSTSVLATKTFGDSLIWLKRSGMGWADKGSNPSTEQNKKYAGVIQR